MSLFPELAITIAAALFGFLGTLAVERFAAPLGLVQAPNERSSHTRPTARGGGVAVAFTIIAAMVVLAALGASELWGIAGLTLAIASLGFADDLLNLSPKIRFPVQIVAFASLIWWGPQLPSIGLPLGLEFSGIYLSIATLLIGLWWVNLFNFMDGIDGIAATHVILVLFGLVVIWFFRNIVVENDLYFWLAVVTLTATLGFLFRNWPPAKIFMGDAGSNALALLIFAIALGTISAGKISYQAWFILTSAFVADATVTLVRRSARGERPWQAHRRHAYQQLSRLIGHKKTTLIYCSLTAFWGIPMAVTAEIWSSVAWILVCVTYSPLVLFCLFANAGSRIETQAK